MRRIPKSVDTMIACGVTCGSMTTEYSGVSGTIAVGSRSVPPMSAQVVPPSVVWNTCRDSAPAAVPLKPGYTTTTRLVSTGSIAIAIGFAERARDRDVA